MIIESGGCQQTYSEFSCSHNRGNADIIPCVTGRDMCLASCGRQHNYPLISVQIVGNDLRTTQREALRKSLLGIVTSSRNSQALNPLISSLAVLPL